MNPLEEWAPIIIMTRIHPFINRKYIQVLLFYLISAALTDEKLISEKLWQFEIKQL